MLSPAGMNVDVISHEMVHSELAARVGAIRWTYAVPVWFDEGMAMYVDHRPAYSDDIYRQQTAAGAPPLRSIATREQFAANATLAYLTSPARIP